MSARNWLRPPESIERKEKIEAARATLQKLNSGEASFTWKGIMASLPLKNPNIIV